MSELVRRVRPVPLPLDVYVDNPHRGCCTFQHFNGDELFPGTIWSEAGPLQFPPPEPWRTDGSAAAAAAARIRARVVDGYLPTTVAYCRWFWPVLEPQQGQYDFSVIDQSLERCAQRGQTLAVRLMSYGSWGQGQVPEWYTQVGPMETRSLHGATWNMPVHDAPEYYQHWGGLIREFARRYDAHPLLESIDITYIGPWGEGAGKCSAEQCQRFSDLWKECFIRTPRIALIAGVQLRIAVASGAGWRCDCYGDLADNSTPAITRDASWNHMYDCYPAAIAAGNAAEAWRTAPVHLESCAVPMTWLQRGYDLDFILEQGLKYHASYWMPKYTRLPERWMEKLQRFSNRLGYRYVYRQAIYNRQVKAGANFTFKSWIENVGVAPLYRDYQFALRFRQGETEEIVVLSDQVLRQWLPGDVLIDQQVTVPASLKPGWAELSAGVIEPSTRTSRVRFANAETYSDRWLDLGGVEVR